MGLTSIPAIAAGFDLTKATAPRVTMNSSGATNIPAGTNFVYALAVAGGGGGCSSGGGGGGVVFGTKFPDVLYVACKTGDVLGSGTLFNAITKSPLLKCESQL